MEWLGWLVFFGLIWVYVYFKGRGKGTKRSYRDDWDHGDSDSGSYDSDSGGSDGGGGGD